MMLQSVVRYCSRHLVAPVALGGLMCALLSSPAHADDYADVNKLVKAGQVNEALVKADQYLTAKPRDPQMRFLKGVILAETGKTNDAINLFLKLTEEFPELPEPYNNLAVLYAGQSQFDKARVALEMAIRTNPSYATAHENLGDVYAKLASQSYSKALQLDSNNPAVPPKLALIRNLFAADAKGAKSAAAPAAGPSATSTTPPSSNSPAKPAPAPATDAGAKEVVVQAVQDWARAWAGKNMSGYLDAYGSKFTPPNGLSRSAWEAERKDRILSKNDITVEVSDVDVKFSGDSKASVTFRQRYKAGSLTSNGKKTLDMVKENGRWLIVREVSGG